MYSNSNSLIFNNISKYLKQYIIEILINLDYYSYKIFNQFKNNNNNNNNISSSSNSSSIKLNSYSESFKSILKYGLVCSEWFIMVSNGLKYLSSNITIKRYSERCLVNPYQIKYYVQECYFKYNHQEYGFSLDEDKLVQLYPNLEEIRYLVTMDYSSTPSLNNQINYFSDDKIFQIKSISNLKISSKSKITLLIVSPSSFEPLVVNNNMGSRGGAIEIDQLIYSSRFGSCSKDLVNLINYYFKPINLITNSVKDYFSYSKDLIESLPSTLESITIGGNNSLELYSLASLSRFQNLKSIQVQFHIHDILYHLGCGESNHFINSGNRVKFKESDYYSEINELKNPCFKVFNHDDNDDDDLVFPYGYSINRLCSVSDDWYEMCESLAANGNLVNLSIGNSCKLGQDIQPLVRYLNNDRFYIDSKGKEKYYSSEEESDRFDLEERVESDSASESGSGEGIKESGSSPIQYINCTVIDDGSGGTIIYGGVPNKCSSDLSSSSEDENDEDYIYDDSDVARCEKKITNRFKKKKKRKEKQYQDYLQFLKDRQDKTNHQFKTNYYKIFNEFSLPKSFTQPLGLIISNNKSIQTLTFKNFDIDIIILSSFKNNLNLINLIFENVLTNIQLEVFLDSIVPTLAHLKYLKVNGVIKPSQNYTIHLNNLLIKFKSLESIHFDFNLNYIKSY